MAAKRDKKLQQIVDVLKREFSPTRMFLFGSRAHGTSHSDSDYDFVLVVPKLRDRTTAMSRVRSLIHEKVGVSADVFCYNQKQFDEWKDELSSIPETALNTGQEIDLG